MEMELVPCLLDSSRGGWRRVDRGGGGEGAIALSRAIMNRGAGAFLLTWLRLIFLIFLRPGRVVDLFSPAIDAPFAAFFFLLVLTSHSTSCLPLLIFRP